jgi:RNA polymerase sigma-70 factor (ECF subfamily)
MEIGSLPENVLSLRKPQKEWRLEIANSPDLAQDPDAKLVEDCKGRRVAAYQRLYDVHGARMKSIALNILENTADAEDAVQEAFLKIFRSVGRFRGECAFATWIYRVLVNACYDLMRKRQRRKPEVQEDKLPPGILDLSVPSASDPPLRLTLEQHLRKLSERRRTVFLHFEVEGFKHREIAGILNISEGKSKTVLFEAKKELQRLIWKPDVPARSAHEA